MARYNGIENEQKHGQIHAKILSLLVHATDSFKYHRRFWGALENKYYDALEAMADDYVMSVGSIVESTLQVLDVDGKVIV